ncbi:MAG: hypothetical protein LLG06_18205 [Desulfobacteraceae bacterium]|nr:hypothetical protein [Desulfobacteraceae bacterium]
MKRYSVSVCVLAVVAITLFITGVSIAGPDSVYKRIHDQRSAIRHALHDGMLSRSDAAVLRGNLDRIEYKLEEYLREGRFNHEHEAKLKRRLHENRELFNRMTRRPPPPPPPRVYY